MAGRQYVNTAYSLGQSGLSTMAQLPIVSKRAPTTSDFANIGTEWVYTTNNAVYIITSIVNNSANWLLLETSGGSGVFASLTVTPGPTSITGTTGINTSGAGVTTINTGGTGALNLGNATGNTAVTGSLSTTTSLSATTTVTAGTGVTSTTGNIVASAGNITATLGNIAASATTSKITGGTIYASGDAGGVPSTTSFTNIANASQSTGALTILSTTANPGTNAGFLKFYLGSTSIFVPYWTNIAP